MAWQEPLAPRLSRCGAGTEPLRTSRAGPSPAFRPCPAGCPVQGRGLAVQPLAVPRDPPHAAPLARRLPGLVAASAVPGSTREGENLGRAGRGGPREVWGALPQLGCPPQPVIPRWRSVAQMQLSPAANWVLLEVAVGAGRRVGNVSASSETLLAGRCCPRGGGGGVVAWALGSGTTGDRPLTESNSDFGLFSSSLYLK